MDNDSEKNLHSIRSNINQFKKGETLRTDVCDENGILLLRAGKVIEDECWIERLNSRNIRFIPHSEHSNVNSTLNQATVNEQSTDETIAIKPSSAKSFDPEKFVVSVKKAEQLKKETVANVSNVFSRLGQEKKVESSEIKCVVSNMISSLMDDERALLSLTNIKDADNYTYMHSVNVSVLAMCLALRVGFSSQLDHIGTGGLMHDIGKTQTPLEILHKNGPLNHGEAYVIQQHPVVGAKIMIDSGGFDPIAVICTRDHHESRNGKGYPTAKKGDEISEYAQIISIADVYDALTTDRPYRQALTPKQALNLMTQKFDDTFNKDFLSEFVALVGYYPVGSYIHLSNKYQAIVMLNDPEHPELPALVKIVGTPDGRPVNTPQIIDLRKHPHLLDHHSEANEKTADDFAPIVMREISGFEAMV